MSSDKKMFKAKVVGNFTYLGANFFYFDEISKMNVLGLKNVIFISLFQQKTFLAPKSTFLRFRQNKKKSSPNM